MPISSISCAACANPGVLCVIHPTNELPPPNPFYHPGPFIQHTRSDPNMFSINLTHSKAYKASSAPNGTSPNNHLDSHLKQSSAQFTGAYAPLGPCPPGAQAQPPSPSTSHLGLPTGSKRKYGTKLGDTATRKVRKAPKRVLDLPPLAATAGIGPSLQRDVSVPLPSPSPVLPSHPVPPTYVASDQTNNPTKELKGRATGASDCWIHLLGVHETGPDLPSNPNVVKAAKEEWVRRTKGYLPEDLRRPNDKFPRLLCLHCLCTSEKWKTWINSDGGTTTGIRTHLEKYHGTKDAGNFDDVTGKDVTPEGLARYIAELVADQDLAFNIIQAKTFRRLLCYVGQGNIQASDIPEQRSVAKVSSDLSQKEKERLKEDMKNSQGRISFTSDLWTDSMERPFMAVTGHYINAAHETINALMGFRVVEGAHAGTILARHLFGVLKEYDVVHK
ncbi:hAT family C-terminal dimerization region, partial [Rhizoctonia solani]